MIVDTHAHFWDWPSDERSAGAARRVADQTPIAHAHGPLSAEELLSQLDQAGVDKLVQVTPTLMGYDNRQGIEGARRHPDRIRVIGRVDAALVGLVERVAAAVEDPFLVGLRLFELAPVERWLTNGSLDPVLDACETYGFPVCVYAPTEHVALTALARRHPRVPVILDHAAAHVREEFPLDMRFDGWDRLRELAALPNVVVKVSGLPEATDESPPYAQAQRRIREVVELFGPDRCMWGSNYPVCLRVSSYEQSLQVVRDACEDLPTSDLDAILGGTATRVLRLAW